MTDVFISYSAKDEEQALKVYSLLSGYGIKTFLAGISLEPGCNWSEEIKQNLNKSQWVLFFASKSACESKAVQQELGGAWLTDKEIIPVIWDIKLEELPAWVKEKQAIDISKGNIELLKPVVDKIARKVKSDDFIGGLILAALFVGLIWAAAEK
tara:strand:+ start:52 stop:513 length:462 start_codon:yes stop_codon:yes gene_type:complete